MTAFQTLKAVFDVNWTTILVGWSGLGRLSPWRDRWEEFPPLLAPEEIANYADERLASTSDRQGERLLVELSSLNPRNESREDIRGILEKLSELDAGDPETELRKWRLILLERQLGNLSPDPLYALTALTKFWQNFGYPPDGPHEVQGRAENHMQPSEYYTPANLEKDLTRHQDWIKAETTALTQLKKYHPKRS